MVDEMIGGGLRITSKEKGKPRGLQGQNRTV
jgi:hypothetical protein